MGEPFATLGDLKDHWSDMPDDKDDDAEQKLKEASILIRGLYPQTDGRIESGKLDKETVTYVVCDMVKEALDIPDDAPASNISQATFTTGPFSQNMSFRSREGNLFLKKIHRQLLSGGGSRNRKAFTITPGGA